MENIDIIWRYSKYYSDMIFAVDRLGKIGEYHSALIVLFNVFELVVKSVREKDEEKLFDDINWLRYNGYINDDEKKFLDDKQSGIRQIRNIMMHRNLYKYAVELDGIGYSFADAQTWKLLYDNVASRLIGLIVKIVRHKQGLLKIRVPFPKKDSM